MIGQRKHVDEARRLCEILMFAVSLCEVLMFAVSLGSRD